MNHRKTLYLMCGIPGSGKSTYVKKNIEKSSCCISRDTIRFNLLGDTDNYFAHEDKVFRIFIEEIQKALNSDNFNSVYVDATHLNEKSRNKVLNKLDLKNVDICPIEFNLPVNLCLKRNENRKNNGRAYVPPSVIEQMSTQYKPPTFKEKYKYIDIIHVTD